MSKIKDFLQEKLPNLFIAGAAKAGTSIRVSMAFRLNFTGVFTDVPPFCYEYGGNVVNTSIVIDGKYPVIAEAQT